jgi:hypothetical protein
MCRTSRDFTKCLALFQRNGSIPAAGSVTVTATVNSGTQGTTICNQGTFAFDADLNGTNESTGTTDDLLAAAWSLLRRRSTQV